MYLYLLYAIFTLQTYRIRFSQLSPFLYPYSLLTGMDRWETRPKISAKKHNPYVRMTILSPLSGSTLHIHYHSSAVVNCLQSVIITNSTIIYLL